MKATLPAGLSRQYRIQVGSGSCTIRGFDIEPIHEIFAADGTTCREPSAVDLTGIDEVVAETMIAAPPVRRRSRPVASRAILLGGGVPG